MALKHDQNTVEAICSDIADGMSLRKAAVKNGTRDTTFLSWCNIVDGVDEQYARALEARGVHYGDRISEIVEDTLTGAIEPAAARVAVDGLKWVAARMAPKRLGDKMAHEITGKNGGPLQISSGERNIRTAGLLAVAEARRQQEREQSTNDDET